MRFIILVAALLMLPSCALIEAYNMSKFDNHEYGLITKIRTNVIDMKEHCDEYIVVTGKLVTIVIDSRELQNYTENIPSNSEAHKMSSELVVLSKSMADYYLRNNNVSEAFCKAKAGQLEKSTTQIQKVLGNKPR